MRAIAATILIVLVAACSAADAPSGSSADRANYQVAVCGALRSLAGNQEDFKSFLSGSSTYEEAVAALVRVQQRTSAAVDRLEASGSWAPGRASSEQLAANQRELLSILADFESFTQTGIEADWQAARSRYEAWYTAAVPWLKEVRASLAALGVTCA